MKNNSYKIYLPSYREFLLLILTYLFIFLKFPFLTITLVILSSFIIYLNNDTEKSILYFFILSFTLPYGFINSSLGFEIGNYINEYVIAGIPLYFILFNHFRSFSLNNFTKTQKIVFLSLFIIFLSSSFLPGILKLTGVGGYRVRVIQIFNYLNAFILFYIFTRVNLSTSFRYRFKNLIIYLGVFLSLFGLIQWGFKISLVPFYNDEFFNYERLFLLNSVNPNACIPFLIVPLGFVLSSIFYDKLYSLKNLFFIIIILLAIFLTYTRISYISIFIIFLVIINKLYRSKILKFIFILFFVFISIIASTQIFNSNSNFVSTGSSSTRVYLWSLGLTALYESPFNGYGLGNQSNAIFENETIFNFLEINDTNSVDTFTKQSVHQYFIDGLLSFGIFYSIPFFLLFTNFFNKINFLINKNNSRSSFYFSVKLSVIGLFIFCLINVMSQHYLFLGFFGLLNKKNLNYLE